jgi:hypothetical protein
MMTELNAAAMINAGQTDSRIVEDGGYIYVCHAYPGTRWAEAKWQVARIDATGNRVFADGSRAFAQTASDPAALTYPDPSV